MSSLFTTVLADDTDELRELVQVHLCASGRFKVVGEASTGVEAVEQAAVHEPDLVLLDLAMPEMDGLEAIPLIRECTPHTRIVVLSGFTADHMATAALELGATAYIDKSIEIAKLPTRLLSILE